MPFIVIAASWPVNKNVRAAAITRQNSGTEQSVHELLAKYQTYFGYKFMIGWYAI